MLCMVESFCACPLIPQTGLHLNFWNGIRTIVFLADFAGRTWDESQSVTTQFDKKQPNFGCVTAPGANRNRKGINDQRVKLACVILGEPIA